MGIRTKRKGIIRQALLLCLCATLAAGCACAEKTEGVNLGISGKNSLFYGTTLSDGRILLVGSHAEIDKNERFGRLLCLNPDRTVSWEYTGDTAEDEYFTCAAELEDGTIGLAFERVVNEGTTFKREYTLRFFTADGKPTGKKVSIPCRRDQADIQSATKSRIQLIDTEVITEAGAKEPRTMRDYNYLIDWDGNEIAFLEGFDVGDGIGDMIEETDGLVMNGYNFQGQKFGKTVRKTDLQGNLIWETWLECAWPDTAWTDAERIIPAGDGGYLVLQTEPVQPDGKEFWKARGALVKLDRDGNILWTCTEGFEEFVNMSALLATADGKTAVSIHVGNDSGTYMADNPRKIAWFDENGKSLGTVEMEFGTENYPQLKRPSEKPTFGIEEVILFHEDRIIPMEDGLWMLGDFIVLQDEGDGIWNLAYYNTGLFKIPEP